MDVKVSVLFNEPKLLKLRQIGAAAVNLAGFSALQRAEIAEIGKTPGLGVFGGFVSVLFNEPKLLKYCPVAALEVKRRCFSALQRAEIAEISMRKTRRRSQKRFQCSSTSRNC